MTKMSKQAMNLKRFDMVHGKPVSYVWFEGYGTTRNPSPLAETEIHFMDGSVIRFKGPRTKLPVEEPKY